MIEADNSPIHLKNLLPETGKMPEQPKALFALLNFGVLESLTSGLVSASAALRIFFNAENCLFIRRHLKNKVADEIMSRGAQLPDLFDVLPTEEAQREFQRELATMRSLSLELLEERRLVA